MIDYKKELLFLNDKVKPNIENGHHSYIKISYKDDFTVFNFFYGHDYLPFMKISYKNNKFYFNDEVAIEINKMFCDFMDENFLNIK